MAGFNKFEKIANGTRYQKRYDYAQLNNKEDIKNLKNMEKYEFLDKQLYGINGWYASFKRVNGAVDWASLDDNTLNAFDVTYKAHQKLWEKVSELTEEYMANLRNIARNRWCRGGSF